MSAPVKRGVTTRWAPSCSERITLLARRQARATVWFATDRLKRAALTPRSTSRRSTSTSVMSEPAIAACRSRAIVSVSGSSGTTCELAPADVAPELLPVERDVGCGRGTLLARRLECWGERGDRKHTSAGCTQRAVVVAPGPGVEDDHVVTACGYRDLVAAAHLPGVSVRGDNRRDRGPAFPPMRRMARQRLA